MDGGLFSRASQLIPADMPLLKDNKFQKDREEYTGRSWSREGIERGRGEALVDMRGAFERVESLVLGDGREWVFGEGPGLGDIEGLFILFLLPYEFQESQEMEVVMDMNSNMGVPLAQESQRCSTTRLHLPNAIPQGLFLDRPFLEG